MDQDSGFEETGQICSTQNEVNYSAYATPGKLKKVLLKNFMCHDHFEIVFNPCINFISGRNGSGKSAIATALVLGFGQRATITSRGISVKNFIKRGKRLATIEITLFNTGEGIKYKQAEYGDEITVIRKISENGGSQYRIRGEKGPETNLNHNEMSAIILNFNIQPNNPICMLSQETAKTFFKQDPSKMFLLFMQGTQLQTIKEGYHKNKNKLNSLKKEFNDNKEELDRIYEDVIKADKLQAIAKKLKSCEDKKQNLEEEFAWANVKVLEEDFKQKSKKLENFLMENENFQNNPENNEQEHYMKRKKQLQDSLINSEREYEHVDVEVRSFEDEISKFIEANRGKSQALQVYSKKIASNEEGINDLKKAINKIQSQNLMSQEHKQQLESVKLKIEEIEATLKTSITHNMQLNDTIAEYKSQVQKINRLTQENHSKHAEIKLKINQLREGRSLGVYGHWMPELIEKIELAYQRREFKQKPRGPLGAYVQVCDQKWLPAVETILRSYLSVFCVSCSEDNKVLMNLMDRTVTTAKQPDIIISKFLFKVHDTRQYEVRTQRYSSLLKGLKISDPIIANCLIDLMGIEQILMVPNHEDALNLMEMSQNVPANCKLCFTLAADMVYPAPSYKFYSGTIHSAGMLQTDSSQQMRTLEEDCNRIVSEIAQYEESKNEILNSIRAIQTALHQSNTEIKNLELKKRKYLDLKFELEQKFQFQPSNIEMYNTDIQNLEASNQELEKRVQNTTNEISNLQSKLQKLKKARDNRNESKHELQEKINALKVDIAEIDKFLREWNQKKYENERKIEEKKEKTKELQGQVSDANKKLLDYKNKIEKEKLTFVEVTRDTKTIQDELKQIKNYIKTYKETLGNSSQMAMENYIAKKNQYHQKQKSQETLQECIKRNEAGVLKEITTYKNIISQDTRATQITFRNLLRIRNLEGELKFDFENRKLHVNVMPKVKGNSISNMSSLSSLSGGERSYAITAFIRAIWNSMTSPFYLLDEFDVFCDIINRRSIIDLLIDHAKDTKHCQFLFITPLDLSSVDTNDKLITVHGIRNPRDD